METTQLEQQQALRLLRLACSVHLLPAVLVHLLAAATEATELTAQPTAWVELVADSLLQPWVPAVQ
jgi:hypothetical protein